MRVMIDDGREFDFKFSCEEQDVTKMYLDELQDERLNIVDEREGCSDFSDRGQVLDVVLAIVDNEITERKNKPQLNNDFLLGIVEEIDDWLSAKGITIPNAERDEQDPEANSNFWGDDFDWIMDTIREHLRQESIVVEDEWEHSNV